MPPQRPPATRRQIVAHTIFFCGTGVGIDDEKARATLEDIRKVACPLFLFPKTEDAIWWSAPAEGF